MLNIITTIISKGWLYLLVPLLVFLAPLKAIFILMLCLVFFDCITACIKSYKKNEGGFKNRIKNIKSRKLKRTIVKSFLYLTFISLIHAINFLLLGNIPFILNAIVATISITEMVSISENIDWIVGGDKFTKIMQKIRKKFEKNINDNLEN